MSLYSIDQFILRFYLTGWNYIKNLSWLIETSYDTMVRCRFTWVWIMKLYLFDRAGAPDLVYAPVYKFLGIAWPHWVYRWVWQAEAYFMNRIAQETSTRNGRGVGPFKAWSSFGRLVSTYYFHLEWTLTLPLFDELNCITVRIWSLGFESVIGRDLSS